MKCKIYLSILLFSIFNSSLFAQPDYTFSQFWKETGDFVKQPAKWDNTGYVLAGASVFLTYEIMMNYDQPIRNAVLKNQRYYKSVPIEFGRMWGEIYSPAVIFSGFAAYSLLTNDIGSRKIAYEIGQASIYAGTLSFLLKLAIGRSRPYLNEGTHSFSPFSSIFDQDNKSLPSGHSTVAFILSTVLSRNVKSPILKVLAYLPAVLTLVSRVYQDQHWTSDVFAGAALGYFVATWVVDQHVNNSTIIGSSSTYPVSIRIALN